MQTDRRQLRDRRSKPTKPLSRYTFKGRRKKARRTDEIDNYYVDRYGWHYLILIGLIMIFCVLDIYLNSKILQLGGSEINPFMALFMKKNLALSQATKILITVGASIFILIHKNFRILGKIKTQFFIYAIFCIYFILVVYESSTLLLI